MSESYPCPQEELLASRQLKIADHVGKELEGVISAKHPLRTQGTRQVANEACAEYMSKESNLIANNLAAIAQDAKRFRLHLLSDPWPHLDALLIGGGLTYAALRINFQGVFPQLDPDAARDHRLMAPERVKLTYVWFNQMCQYSREEVENVPGLNDILSNYERYLPRPDTVDSYYLGAGLVAFHVDLADAQRRVHEGQRELYYLEQQFGQDLKGVFGFLYPDRFKGKS